MARKSDREPKAVSPDIDPSIVRGLTSPRMSRRQLLSAAGDN